MRFFPVIIIFAIIVVMGSFLLSGKNPNELISSLIDKKVPDITFPAVKGYKDLTPDYFIKSKQKVTLINFFASWCGPCKQEHSELMRIKNLGVPIIGVAYNDKEKNILKFIHQNGNPYINIVKDVDGNQAYEWGLVGVPETFFVDSKGIIKYRHTGPITFDIYRKIMRDKL